MKFNELNLSDNILKALFEKGYKNPSPIQIKTIPLINKGKDIIAMAETGSGKTAAFCLPLIQKHLSRKGSRRQIKTLIITPTRELASQVNDSLRDYSKYSHLKVACIFGGVSQFHQVKQLRSGVDVVVATPGRLLDLINQKKLDLSYTEHLVLDEADRMLDMGFIHDIKRILRTLPGKRQNIFFSATMPKEFRKLAAEFMVNPVTIASENRHDQKPDIRQFVYHVEKGRKKALLHHIIKNEDMSRVLVFTRTKHGANKLTKSLIKLGIQAEAIHGDKTQSARNKALNNFKGNMTRVLVATDVASRGIDISHLPFVINYEVPESAETYTHRIGRTGRAGTSGIAYSFCDNTEKRLFRSIKNLHNEIENIPFPNIQEN